MFLNTETEAAGIAEVSPQELILLDLEPTLQKLHCLLASHRHVTRYLLVTPDPERPNGVPSCYTLFNHKPIKSQIEEREKRGLRMVLYPWRRQGFGH